MNSIQEVDEPALIPHIAEASSIKYPYEVLFRSLHKLLMDTASSEYFAFYSSFVYYLQNVICSKFVNFLINSFHRYNFCDEFFGEQSMFYEIFAGNYDRNPWLIDS